MISLVSLHVSLVMDKIIMKSRRMRWTSHITLMERKKRNVVGKPEGKGPLGRPRHRWMDHRDIEWVDVDWIYLAQDTNQWRALLNSVINIGNFLSS
jgi:hypothetical protein